MGYELQRLFFPVGIMNFGAEHTAAQPPRVLTLSQSPGLEYRRDADLQGARDPWQNTLDCRGLPAREEEAVANIDSASRSDPHL
jgi:hypothetical protein